MEFDPEDPLAYEELVHKSTSSDEEFVQLAYPHGRIKPNVIKIKKNSKRSDSNADKAKGGEDGTGEMIQNSTVPPNVDTSAVSTKKKKGRSISSEDRGHRTKMEKALKDGLFTDVTFLVYSESCASEHDFREIKAHRVILASKSDYFRTMFSGGFKEGIPGDSVEKCKDGTIKVTINDADFDAFSRMLSYLYTGSDPALDKGMLKGQLLDLGDILAGLGIADKFLLQEWASDQCDRVRRCANSRNIKDCLFFCMNHPDHALNEVILEIVAKDYSAYSHIIKDISSGGNTRWMLDFMIKVADVQCRVSST